MDNINLTIGNGMFGLLGPNGAGKSTLMRILVTLMQASSGEVTIDGMDINTHRREVRTMVGYLPQDFRFFTRLRSWEFLDYAARLGGMNNRRKRRERIDEMLSNPDVDEGTRRFAEAQRDVPTERIVSIVQDPDTGWLFRTDPEFVELWAWFMQTDPTDERLELLIPRGAGYFHITQGLEGQLMSYFPVFAEMAEFFHDGAGRAVSFEVRNADDEITMTGVRVGG